MTGSIDKKLQRYRSALINTSDYAPLRRPLAKYTYDHTKLVQGQALLDKVMKLQSTKDDTRGAQKDATDAITQRWNHLRPLFSEHRQLARMAFKEQRGVLTQLKLDTRLKSSFSGWIAQATAFYSKIGQYSEGIERYGVKAESLQEIQTQLEELLALYDQQSRCKAEAQHTTEQRNRAMKELDTWMREFFLIAKIALKDEPQLLEMLGLVVPSVV